MNRSRWSRTALLFCILVCASRPAFAQKKTDIISLANGDRFTGEIASLARGRLGLKTDDAGTIDIEWDNIVRISAIRQFEVETSGGRRLLGSLGSTADGTLDITNGTSRTSLPMAEITRITPIGASFWSRLEGSVDAGFSYTKSSDVAQVNLNSTTLFRRPAFVIQWVTSATVTAQSDQDQNDDRAATELAYARFIGRTWFLAGSTRFETNESLGLELRSQVGGVVGRRLINSNRANVEAAAGLVGNEEHGVDSEPTRNFEGILQFASSYYSYDGPKSNVDFKLQYYPSFSNWGRQRLQIDTSLKRELWKDFVASFNLYYTFDSRPPNPSAARSDLGVTLSMGWVF